MTTRRENNPVRVTETENVATPTRTVPTERRVVERGPSVDATTPVDLVRWGPVLAGLFAALSTLIVLGVLGLAIGASSIDPNDPAGAFGIGAGIWSAITALLAFGIGGWFAARSAALHGSSSGLLNGAMVWIVGIPLLIFALGSGIGSLVSTAGSIAGTAAQVAAPAAGQAAQEAAQDPSLQASAQAGGQEAGQAIQATAQALQQAATDPQNVERTADNVANTAWGTLLSLGLSAAAALGGGFLGGKSGDTRRNTRTAVRA